MMFVWNGTCLLFNSEPEEEENARDFVDAEEEEEEEEGETL